MTTRQSGASTSGATLSFEGIEKRYGDVAALAGVSLDVGGSEILCLLGPSGCGKTTLLRIASGIERPTRGRVLVSGDEVAGPNRYVPPEQRRVGLMFQDFALFPHLSVLDNVTFGLKALPRETATGQAQTALERVGMLGHATKYPHMLSGGEQQRVALARALVPRPAVMLMDEPFSGLDVHLRERLQEETAALLRESRTTTIIVTHDPEEAMRLADRIAVMRHGRLIQVGAARELHQSPADLLIARLFSEINEIPWTAEAGALKTPLGNFAARGIGDGERAVLCIRQGAVELVARSETETPAQVVRVRLLGDFAAIELAVPGFEAPIRARIPSEKAPVPGSETGVRVDPRRALVFRAEDGNPRRSAA